MDILIIDDYPIVYQGIKYMLAELPGEYRLLYAQDVPAAKIQLKETKVNLVITEINFYRETPESLVKGLKNLRGDIKILVYSDLSEQLYAVPLLRAGARGFLPKQSKIEELSTAISLVLQGRTYLRTEALLSLLPRARHGQQSG